MELAIAAISTLFESIKGCVGLNRRVKVKDLETHINQLSKQVTDLETELREGKRKRKMEVDSWIEKAKGLINEFQTLKEGTIHGSFWKKLTSLDGVKKMKEIFEELRDEEPSVDVDECRVLPLVVSPLSGKTSTDNLEKLCGWLEDDKVSSIGVYGMGGVGKTALVKHIHNRILKEMPHFKVFWVSVSQDSTIKTLQDYIAKMVGLEIHDEGEEQRAAFLHQHFVGKKTVVILDDVWKGIQLEKLGNLARVDGCKFIITSRSRQVCCMMECQRLFKVKPLDDNEAWDLFKKTLGHTVTTCVIEELAKKLAKKCGGLPLALKIVAASMRGALDVHGWRNAIKNFQESSLELTMLERDVFEVLEVSYNRLDDEMFKYCLLYCCCLYPEDDKIEKNELILKFIEEGLCDDMDEGHFILNKLVDVSLLEYWKEEYVTMNVLIRDMGLRIQIP